MLGLKGKLARELEDLVKRTVRVKVASTLQQLRQTWQTVKPQTHKRRKRRRARAARVQEPTTNLLLSVTKLVAAPVVPVVPRSKARRSEALRVLPSETLPIRPPEGRLQHIAARVVLHEERRPIVPNRQLDPLDQRERCDVHGYVGRVAFQRDQHALCMMAMEPEDEIEDVSEDQAQLDAIEVETSGPNAPKRARVHEVRTRPRAKSVFVKKITRAVLQEGALALAADGEMAMPERPRRRADCTACATCQDHVASGDDDEGLTLACGHLAVQAANRCRPCIWVGCQQHNFLDVTESGSIKLNFPELEPDELAQSCTLDLADERARTLDETGKLLNVTRERARQLEVKGLMALKQGLTELETGYDPDVGQKRVWRDDRGRIVDPKEIK